MNTPIIFRRGTNEDIPAFLAFFKTSLPLLFPYYSPHSVQFTVEVDYGPKWLAKKIKEGTKIVYLAFENKNIVGYLLVSQSIAGVAFADWLGVDKAYQERGIASQLLTLWEQEALIEGAHALQLWTTENNVIFYKKRGFSSGGLFPKAWHGEDSYLIYKTLRKPEEKNFLKKYLQQQIKKT